MNCSKCGKELPAQEGAGRPRKFCSDACTRAATMEIRRLNARIAQLEKNQSLWRIKGANGWAENATKEIELLERRLALLVAASEERDHAE